jgi:hypothetical protein
MSLPTNTPKEPDERSKNNRPNGEDLIDYFKNHTRETIAYVLLIVGILLLFYAPVYGGILVGVVAGIYFGDEVVAYIRNWTTYINTSHGYAAVARHLISAGVAVAFFICAPAIFLGAALSIGIKQLFVGPDHPDH